MKRLVGSVTKKSCKDLYINETLSERCSQSTRFIWVISLEKSFKLSLVSKVELPNKEYARKGCVEEKKSINVILKGNLDSV